MADPALTQLQDKIADALKSITSLKVAFGHVPGGGMGYPYGFTEVVSSKDIGQSYNLTEVVINVYVLYGSVSGEKDVQRARDKSFTGSATTSVSAALRADETFGGLCITSTITDPNRAIFRESAGYEAFGVTWELKALLNANS